LPRSQITRGCGLWNSDHACTTSGFSTSVYIGYQWALASGWVAGIETDFSYATNSGTTGVPGVSSAPGDNINVKEDWDGGVLSAKVRGQWTHPSH